MKERLTLKLGLFWGGITGGVGGALGGMICGMFVGMLPIISEGFALGAIVLITFTTVMGVIIGGIEGVIIGAISGSIAAIFNITQWQWAPLLGFVLGAVIGSLMLVILTTPGRLPQDIIELSGFLPFTIAGGIGGAVGAILLRRTVQKHIETSNP